MDKLLFKKILITAISILAAIYVAYLLISANFNMYPTENAVETTVTDKIYSNGFILRDESYIKNNSDGTLSYTLSDGDAVKQNGVIAKTYSSESDAAAQTKADLLQEKVDALQNLQNTYASSGVGIDTINNDIQNNITTYLSNINNGEVNNVSSDVGNIVFSINQRQAFTGKISSFKSEISDLQSKISTLRGSSGKSTGTIKSDKAGYFSAHCDGYENSLNYSKADELKLSDLQNVKKSTVPSNTAGKVVSNLNWYVVCKVTSDQATNLSLWGQDVTVLFSDASTDSVPASIYKINQSSKDSDALIILKCNYMNSDMIEARQEPVEIGLGTYSGLRVSKKAIHDDYVQKTTYDDNGKKTDTKKKVQGVYVLYGSEVHFKEISILYAGKDFVLCDPAPDSKTLFSGDTVSLYDQIILKGDDLYDGKVIK